MKWETSVGSLIPLVFKRINQTKDGEIEFFSLNSILTWEVSFQYLILIMTCFTEEWFLKVLPIKTQENINLWIYSPVFYICLYITVSLAFLFYI